ncbi:MAG: hypothetical protein RB292_03965 [Patescibacteria group bacterium]|jgi:hypothetical protein|nr:hypothetical protein [Patescibacteria group bacterium]
MPVGDDALKRELLGTDHDRCNGAYEVELPETEDLQAVFARNYLEPGGGDYEAPSEAIAAANRAIDESAGLIRSFLSDGRVVMVVPMRERGDVTRPLLGTITKLMPADSITVINHDSDDDAVNGVRRYPGVCIPYWADMLDTLDWGNLLPILNLDKRPSGFGKGLSVLAGYLHRYFLARSCGHTPDWLCQHDAEIQEYQRYRALEFLIWAMIQRPDAQYVKQAKFGRTNERCMLARSLLMLLSQSTAITDDLVRARCAQMFEQLLPDKWMLTGEFMLRWEYAMARPFASGYLEETLTAMFMTDICRQNGGAPVYVANPNPRLDAANDDGKEAKMQQEISAFIFRMALEAPSLDRWDIDTITELNRTSMAQANMFGWIPPNDHPVRAEILPANRLFPSIDMMVDAGLVDVSAGVGLVSR